MLTHWLTPLQHGCPQQSQDFVRSIERFLRTSPFDYKLAGMYVIDAISRNAHAIWRKKGDSEDGNVARQILERFESMFNSIDLAEIFRKCSEKDKVGILEPSYRCHLGVSIDRVAYYDQVVPLIKVVWSMVKRPDLCVELSTYKQRCKVVFKHTDYF